MIKHGAAVVLLLLTHGASQPRAQNAPPDRFEVASIKPNNSPLSMMGARDEPGGRFVATNLSLRQLVGTAYRLRDFQIVGGPGWIDADRFDVNAKADRELPPFDPSGGIGPLERMLQWLLADRFGLVVRNETREMSIYALVVARPDGRLGDKLRPSAVDCAALFADRARSGQPAGPVVTGDRPTCGMVVSPWSIRVGGGSLSQLTMVLA